MGHPEMVCRGRTDNKRGKNYPVITAVHSGPVYGGEPSVTVVGPWVVEAQWLGCLLYTGTWA